MVRRDSWFRGVCSLCLFVCWAVSISGLAGCGYGLSHAVRDARSTLPAKRQKAIDYLIQYISKTTGSRTNHERRRRAIRALGYTQMNRAVGPLRMVLMHEKLAVLRKEAIRSLSRLKAVSALQELREALRKDKDVDVRMLAAATLGRVGDRRAKADLIRALKDPQPAVRTAAVRALATFKAEEAIPRLIDGLCDKHIDVVGAASQALILMKKKALPFLLKELDERSQTRRSCVVAFFPKLGFFARSPLIRAFAKKATRMGAKQALIQLTGDTVTWPIFEKMIDKPQSYDGRKDLLSLKTTGTPTTVHAAFGLWYMVPVRYRLLFRNLLGLIAKDKVDKVRSILKKAALSGPDLGYRMTAVIAIGDTGPAALSILRSFLQSPTRALVVSAIYGLGKVGGKGLPYLEPYLRSKDEDLRFAAMRSIGQIRTARAMELLRLALKDKAAKMRIEALKGLAFQQNKQSIPRVRKMLSDPIIDVVMTAIQTLIKLGDTRNVKMYIQALRRGPYPPKSEYVRTLGKLGDNRALPFLKKLADRYLKDWKSYRKQAKRMYRQGLRRMRDRTKSSKVKLRMKIKDKLKNHQAVNPMALCAFFETVRALLRLNHPTQEMFGKIGGQLNSHFNPLSHPVDLCPWPALRSNTVPIKP